MDNLLILKHEAKLEGTVMDIGVFGEIGVDQACSGIHGLQARSNNTFPWGLLFIWLDQ